MDLILCHQTADFDAIGSAIGLSRLHQGSKIVLTGGVHPSLKSFLGLHRDEFNFIEFRSINPHKIRRLFIVDTQQSHRLGKAAEWLNLQQLESITIYDHHQENDSINGVTFKYIEKVGACCTIICEHLQQNSITITPVEATAIALGIHVDTGSLTYEQTTPRDGFALAWLMTQGVNIRRIGEYVEPNLSPQLRQLLPKVLNNIQTEKINSYSVGWVLIETPNFIPGLSNLTAIIKHLIDIDIFLFCHFYNQKKALIYQENNNPKEKLTIIGRSKLESVNLASLFADFGGGGHSNAASFTYRCHNPQEIINNLIHRIKDLIPSSLTAKDLMSSPVRTILPDITIEEAQRILLRYGHSGLFVVNKEKELVGVISRRDIDLALHHGFCHAPVKGYMTKKIQVINFDTPLSDIEEIIVTKDVGRLPVVDNGNLIGIVTRTDILRNLHQTRINFHQEIIKNNTPLLSCLSISLEKHLQFSMWQLLQKAANYAQSQGWHLYLVGGGVRDLLLMENSDILVLQDIDLVVDGFHHTPTTQAGVKLAKALQNFYPQARLSIHGNFQTAALLWHDDDKLGSLWVDIATARTEFYPYPAANPEVESSSIRQDLYRRDFTINALAIRLTSPHKGELLDFFGGLHDLRSQIIKVLHPNSFIEDPTRIYRAVRFAVRLNFTLENETKEYINYAIKSGIYEKISLEKKSIPALTTRLKAELNYILQAKYWKPALKLLDDIGALKCLHQNCQLTSELWWQIRCLDRWLKYYDLKKNHQKISSWLLRLEIILASFPEGIKVAENLQLPQESIERLRNLEVNNQKIKQSLITKKSISQKVTLLNQYQQKSLLIIAVKNEKKIRHDIWQYLMKWSNILSPLNGEDLQKLGYKPNKKFKEMLTTIEELFLDGEITNYEEAKIFILKKYPL